MPKQRLLSLDVLRGMTVALMILVNNAGDERVTYAQLRHSVWNGCTVTDVVFPTFLFIVGGAIALAFRNRLARGASRAHILSQVFRRSLLIFLFGFLLNALPYFHWTDLRIYGVLQRIALCYGLASIVYLYGGLIGSAIGAVLSLGIYAWLLSNVRVPGFGMPGVDIRLLDPAGNLPAWLDRQLLPAAHLYHHSFYDPEGLLSTLPALGTTLLGVLAALWLQSARPLIKRVTAMALASGLLIAFALLWAEYLPLNKRLWTSSYALLTAGIAAAVWTLLFWLIDGPLQLRRGLTPWLVFGTNALTAYILSELLAVLLALIPVRGGGNLQQWIFQLLPHWLGPPPFVSMLYSILYVGVCMIPVLFLYRNKVFLKI
jgi:predicted acyltransferase